MLRFKIVYGKEGYMLAKGIRETVFLEEQGFPYDYDENDEISYHIAGWDGDRLIASGRLFAIADGIYTIGRVAVDKDYRKQYIGDTIMKALEDKAVGLGAGVIELHAQEAAVGFYEREGYVPEGDAVIICGARHQKMVKDMTKINPCGGCKSCAHR